MFFIYYIFLLFLFRSLAKNFRETVLAYVPIRIIMHQGIILWPVNPTVMFDTVACFTICIFYFGMYQGKTNRNQFPLFFPLILLFCSEFLSAFMAMTSGNTLNFLQNTFVGILFLYVVWKCLCQESDLIRVLKGYSIIFSIAIILSCFEQVAHFNPIIHMEKMLLPANAPIGLIWESTQVRFGGLFRSQAFMPISITYGGYCVIFFIFYFLFSQRYTLYIYYQKVKNKLFMLGLVLGTVLSGSKSPIMSLLIGFLPYVKLKWFHNIKLIISIICIASLISTLAIKMYDDIYEALTVENSYEYSGGSSLAMREVQFDISFNAFKKSPVIGNGTKYTQVLCDKEPLLLGAESIWFKLLIEKGIIGIIAFLTLVLYPIFHKRFRDKKIYIALSITWIVLNTMTTLPGMDNTFFYTLILLTYRAQLFYSENGRKDIINNNSCI